MSEVPLLGLVALPADIPEHDLTRGQVGAVVEHLERDGNAALLVEFSDRTPLVCDGILRLEISW
jgi:hypothetical protein